MTPKHAHTPTVSLGSLFGLLKHPYRRYILYHFTTQSAETATLAELVDSVRTQLDASPPRKQLTTELQHNHLPKLADHNVIDYDARSETIRYCDGDRIETVVAFSMRQETTS